MAPAIGIDLGTTYSSVGVFLHGKVEIIANEQGYRITPSYVSFDGDMRMIGDAAKLQAAVNPSNTVFDVKRLIGRHYKDRQIQEDLRQWPFEVVDHDGKPIVCVQYEGKQKYFHPEEISAMVLGKMKETAETFLGEKVTDAVITVPTYFNGSQRQATKDAGLIAGLNVLRVINEPTAAALAYGLDRGIREPRNVLVFDLGGGTFDVSVMTIDKGPVFNVKAASGNTHLGGEDFDSRLVNHFIKDCKRVHGKDISRNPKALRRLRSACEFVKRRLSSVCEADIDVDALIEGIDYRSKITRAKFEELCSDLFENAMKCVEKALTDAKMKTSDIHDVVLIGGSSRIPKVQHMLKKFFKGKELCMSINPEEAVSYGAAVEAALRTDVQSKNIQDIELVDVTPLSLGIEVKGGLMSIVIDRNSTIPCSVFKMFTTVKDNQDAVKFSVYEGERAEVEENYLLGVFILEVAKKVPKGVPKFKVIFQLDVSGILEVSAVEEGTKNSRGITITCDRRNLPAAEIQRMLEEAKRFEARDREYRERVTARNDLEGLAYSILKKVESVSDLRIISAAENKVVKDRCEAAVKWMNENKLANIDEIKKVKSQLQSSLSTIIRKIDAGRNAKILVGVD